MSIVELAEDYVKLGGQDPAAHRIIEQASLLNSVEASEVDREQVLELAGSVN